MIIHRFVPPLPQSLSEYVLIWCADLASAVWPATPIAGQHDPPPALYVPQPGQGSWRSGAPNPPHPCRQRPTVAPPCSPRTARLKPRNPRDLTEWLQLCYDCSMFEVPSRDLRNDTAGLLRRVQAGEDITVTVNGKPVALLTALRPARRRWLSRDELLLRLRRAQADPGLRRDLAALAGDTTDDLGPVL
jgi:prevent-host-death family protein